jgi:hypothetical protein
MGQPEPLPPGLSALHIILWNFAIIAFVQADEKQNAFVPADIWILEGSAA